MPTYLSPLAHRLRAGRPVTALGSIEGVVLGLLHNTKPNASLLLDFVAEELGKRATLAGVVRTSKPVMSEPAPDEVYGELERECGAVVFASAD